MHEEEGGGDEYEYFETPEDVQEDSRESYVKKMIKDSKDQDGQFRRPDYKPGSISKEMDEKEYESPITQETEGEKPKPAEKKKEEYEL
ncbi:MAG: hypothetical protein GTN38_03795, partial [Candidatus Aenigmarchaeota archaeon]|nr:hypothetical protein [Candidatus Aenigmarchaeota archaeon]NIP40785.1 hypothetical protein [Candidatus Aenigmarchaeota archaeon]NIQ17375.1 hypothetical protein [Candidatus Aenigmarchaeota archaeon]NIS73488.1 hypothetical protein [Candidatus Aenigmarchaeota archaeon]